MSSPWDADISTNKDGNQLEGPSRRIPHTNTLFPDDILLLTNLLGNTKNAVMK